MALLFIDGFDVGDIALKWTTAGNGGGHGASATTPYGAGLSLQLSESGGWQIWKKNVTPSATVYMGFAFMRTGDSRTAGSDPFVMVYSDNGATVHLQVGLNNALGTYTLYLGSTAIATSAGSLHARGAWYFLEFAWKVDAVTGSFTMKQDGVTVLTFSGNTKNGGTSTNIDAVGIKSMAFGYIGGQQGDGNYYFDDLYAGNGVGAVNNSFLGSCRVQTLLPTAAGSSTQLTPSVGSNWDNVNDVPYVSTTYNTGNTSGQRDTYAMGDLRAGTGTIFGVQDTIMALKSDAGSVSIKAAIKSGATVYYDTTQSLTANLTDYSALRETDPATSAAWTTASVNAIEFGAEIA